MKIRCGKYGVNNNKICLSRKEVEAMYDGVYYQMVELAMEQTEDDAIRKGLHIALDLLGESSTIMLTDWEDMTEEEQLETIEQYI